MTCRAVVTAAMALGLSSTLLVPAPGHANQADLKSQQPPRSLIQKLRAFLGINPPIAIGGSRGGSSQAVCVINPWIGAGQGGNSEQKVMVPSARPTLLSAGPLNEIQLQRDGQVVWQQRASSTQPVSGPIAWPIAPLRPGEQVMLRLRPRGASGGDFAEIPLQAAAAEVLQRHQSLIEELRSEPTRWQAVVERQAATNPAMAVALASDPSAPQAIQQALIEAAGCR